MIVHLPCATIAKWATWEVVNSLNEVLIVDIHSIRSLLMTVALCIDGIGFSDSIVRKGLCRFTSLALQRSCQQTSFIVTLFATIIIVHVCVHELHVCVHELHVFSSKSRPVVCIN